MCVVLFDAHVGTLNPAVGHFRQLLVKVGRFLFRNDFRSFQLQHRFFVHSLHLFERECLLC